MKENVFSREEPDGSITVYNSEVEANAPDLRAACALFVRRLKSLHPWSPITVQAADND
jgi:hypothetical protein